MEERWRPPASKKRRSSDHPTGRLDSSGCSTYQENHMSQLRSYPHAGQRRYHDFSKLQELHRQRQLREAYSSLTRSSIGIGGSKSTSVFLGPTRLFHSSGELNSSWNPLTGFLRTQQLKRLEAQANQSPSDALLQSQFLEELAKDHPSAVVARVKQTKSSHAMDASGAMVYLQALSRTNAWQHLDSPDLVQRLASSSVISQGAVETFQAGLRDNKWGKPQQAQQILQLIQEHQPGVGASVGTSGMAGAGRGLHPQNPLHVQITGATPSLRGMVLSGLKTVFLVSVAFACLGALLDDKGLRGAGGISGIGSGSKHVQEAEVDGRKVKFEDVKGVEEAKAELEEIVMYLKDPSRFTRLGGKLPRGVLLTGPPGTGKTLLAKAIAGEADVPFFYSSGSQFEEVYVGLGAKRIRELFEAAKTKAPAIIFIDEIDAVGGTRKLKDQSALKMTLNELLVQLDGFDGNNGVIVIGATNFPESLDEALLRPGRFDKHVVVPLPDVGGRQDILEMYSKKTKLTSDVDLSVIARGTTGFSGADLFNLMNQAALKASVDGLEAITMSVLEYAKDKIMMGAERKSAVITPESARKTAYHEAGHAVVAVLTEGAMPVHKATIMPRGRSLGMVTMLPEGDQTSQSLQEMLAYMDVCMGGRVAEELIFGKEKVTSGASSDIQQATNTARNMVTKWGFSDNIGVVFHGGSNGEDASSQTRAQIDQEVKQLTETSYRRAKDLLSKYKREHKLLAETLLEYETLTGDEVRELVKKRRKPKRPAIPTRKEAPGKTKTTSSRLPGIRNQKESSSQ